MSSGPLSPIEANGRAGVFSHPRFAAAILFFGLFLFSCTPKSVLRLEEFGRIAEKGDYLKAALEVKKKPKRYGNTGLFLYHMDVGILYHYAGLSDSSNRYLQNASDIDDALFTRSATNEAASLLVNDNVRPYRGKPYELVFLHQARELNYLERRLPDEALVEARQTQLLFNEWKRQSAGDGRYTTDPMFHYVTSVVYDGQGEVDDAMISLFDAVTAFKRGPVSLPPSIKDYTYYMLVKNNREEDVKRLGLSPGVPESAVPGLSNGVAEIVVIGYAGKGPALVEESWWGNWIRGGLLVLHHTDDRGEDQTLALPAPMLPEGQGGKTRAGTTVFIKVALPKLRTYSSRTAYFTVQGPKMTSATSVIINNFDRQAAKQLEDSKTALILRTVTRTVIRTLSAQEIKNQMRTGSPIANLLLNLGTDVLSGQLEKADTRSCFFIPKTVQIARIPVTPGVYSVTVSARTASGEILSEKTFTDIRVEPRRKRFLIYSSLN